jgi:hypothetical protein
MAVLFLVFLCIRSVQNGSNLIKLDFSPIKKCYYKNLSHLQKEKNGRFIFLDQICPKWIKLDQIGFLTNQKMLIWKIVTFTKKDNIGHLIFDFFGSDPSKIDQTWPNFIKLDFSPIKKCYNKKLSPLQKG